MSGHSFDLRGDESQTKKLLRFGTDRPECADCQTNDTRLLCRVKDSAQRTDLVLCRNCNAKRKPLSAKTATQKANRFKDAGYFKPACVICEEPNLQILELDHTAGKANSTIAEPLCANHHATKSFMAESGPMAVLRLRDPNRSALLLQAAFELGLAAILGGMAVIDGAQETARSVWWGLLAIALVGWALWNIAADSHFEKILGPGYDRAIPAEIPS
jgi:hypothetical protein